MKKICFLTLNGFVPWGGSEDLWHQTAIVLHKKGFSVYVICMDWKQRESAHIKELEDLGVKIIRMPFLNTFYNKVRRALKPIFGDRQSIFLKKAIRYINPDFVAHTNLAPRGGDVLAPVVKAKIPYLIDVQLADEFLWHTVTPEMVACYKKANGVYFLSDKNKHATEKQLGVRLENAKRHYNPIKIYEKNSVLEIDGPVKFACVARMGVEHKRQDLLLEILATENWKNKSWELYFVGSGEHLQSLKNLTKMYGLEQKVFFKGQVTDIAAIWQECHALLLPSMYEGMSLAVMECMKAARVAIVTNAGGNKEFITDGDDGFIAEAATFDLYAKAMDRAWDQLSNWPSIGLKAQQRVNKMVPADAATYFAEEIISYL